jgi:RNA polymerase sigma-70 factor, ECF subfamily
MMSDDTNDAWGQKCIDLEMEETMDISDAYSSQVVMTMSSDNATDYDALHTDQRLVLAAQSGCQAAFGELWTLYSRRIYRTVFSITNNAQDAEDAMQESFLRAFLHLESFEGRSRFYSWLTRIAINSALGILRKRRSHPETILNSTFQQEDESAPEEFIDLTPDPEQTYDQVQRSAILMDAIHRLPMNLREAVEVRIAEDCSVKEVACRLKISEPAAKARLHRARKQLRSLTTSRYVPRAQAAASVLSETLPG